MGAALGGLGTMAGSYMQSQYEGKANKNATTAAAQMNQPAATTAPKQQDSTVTMAAQGGLIEGPGTDTSDSIPANLSNGEYIIPADVVRQLGSNYFDRLVSKHNHTGQKPPPPQQQQEWYPAPVQGYAGGGVVNVQLPRPTYMPLINTTIRRDTVP